MYAGASSILDEAMAKARSREESDEILKQKDRAKELLSKRDTLEKEINGILDRLNAPGMPGERGNLVDEEGFPRGDIDVHAIRSDRNRFPETPPTFQDLQLIYQGHSSHT